MGIVTWVVVGVVLGFIASLILGKENTVANVVIGLVGAGLAGWIATLFNLGTFTVFNGWNLLISIGGAALLSFVFALIQRNSAS